MWGYPWVEWRMPTKPIDIAACWADEPLLESVRSGGAQPFAAAFIQADPIQHAVQRARPYSAVAEGVLQSQTGPGFCAGLSASPSAARHARAAQTLSYPHSHPRSRSGFAIHFNGRVRGS